MKHPRLFLKKRYWIPAIILLMVAAVWVFFPRRNGALQTAFTAQKTAIAQEVTVTGNTKPAHKLDLSFERSGIIRHVYADVGTKVKAGQTIADLDASDLSTQLLQANASTAAAQAKLDELKRGSRPEDIQVTRTALLKAKQDLANEYNGVTDIANDAYSQADDAVRKQLDPLFTNDEQVNVQLSFGVSSAQIAIDAAALRTRESTDLNAWKSDLESLTLSSSPEALERALQNSLSRLSTTRTFLDAVMNAVQNATSLDASTLLTYKSYVTTARTNVNAALAKVNDRREAIATEKVSVKKAEDELNLKLAGTDPHEVAAQEAAVAQAEANAASIRVQIGKTALRAPINGIITKQDAKVGQVTAANTPLVSLISEGNLEIEANIPEADIAKVKIGDPATVTLDALGNAAVFDARVVSVDPAETMIEGVATYLTKLLFTQNDPRVKPGMTANITVVTDTRENALAIPQRAVRAAGNKNFVDLILSNGKTEEREVTVGLRGSSGLVEVLSGLSEGDRVTARASSQ